MGGKAQMMLPLSLSFFGSLLSLTFAIDLHLRRAVWIAGDCAGRGTAAAAAGADGRTIGGRATRAGRDLGPKRRQRGRRGRRGRCGWRGQRGGLQFDATRQSAAPLARGQAAEHTRSLHAIARRAADLRLGAVVGAVRSANDRVVVVARQRITLDN